MTLSRRELFGVAGGSLLATTIPAAAAAAPAPQYEWRWCRRCEGLWFSGHPNWGACPAGGSHVRDGSGDYGLHGVGALTGQSRWRWCHRCEGLWFGGGGAQRWGVCPAGGRHSRDGSGNYVLTKR